MLISKYKSALFVWLLVVFLFPNISLAQIVCDTNKHLLSVVVREPNGEFIPGANIKIFKQIYDADGQPKPGDEVASGKTGALTGIFTKEFGAALSDNYVIKTWVNNSSEGAFWFFDVYVGCELQTDFTVTLSGLQVIIRDSQEELVKNKKFKLYTQKEDVDGEPLKEKKELVGEFNTSDTGEAVIYVPDSGRSLDGRGPEYYVFEMEGPMGGLFVDYNVSVSDNSMRQYEYSISDAEVFLKDFNNISFPSGVKLTFYEQVEDINGENVLGPKIKELLTDDYGRILWQYPAGVYAAALAGDNGQLQYFWNIEIVDGQRETYYLKTEGEWETSSGACASDSTLVLATKRLDGSKISGLKFSLHEEKADINGRKMPGARLVGGVIEETGKSTVQINPDPRKKYALRIYDRNDDVGEFWYYDGFQFNCGENAVIEKNLPALNVVLRGGDGSLYKDYKFSLYTQKYDVDGRPIKEKQDLVADSLNTSSEGEYTIFLGPDNPYNDYQNGYYVFQAKSSGATFTEYDINITPGEDNNFEYIFSDLILTVKDGAGKFMDDRPVRLFSQERDELGILRLGKELASKKTDANGIARFEYPSGYYALSIKDSLGQNNSLWSVKINNRARTQKEFKSNLTKVLIQDANGENKAKGTGFQVFDMVQDENGLFYKNEKKKDFTLDAGGVKELQLAPGPYLIVHTSQKQQYGKAIYTENNKLQELAVKTQPAYLIRSGQSFSLPVPAGQFGLAEKLKGHILLQVEERGEAWYVDHNTKRRYYMKDGPAAYELMRHFGLGITSADLAKIPVGIDERFETFDYDGDAVFDKMEEAVGTDMYMHDSDGDGFDDGTELLNGYDPNGSGRLNLDYKLRDRLLGKILLQVESRGEAWYLNPRDGRRYYMPDGEAAYEIMRFLSLGITNENIEQIEEGRVSGM